MKFSCCSILIILAIGIPTFAMSSVDVRFVSVDPKINVTTNLKASADAGIHNLSLNNTLIPAFSLDPLDTHDPSIIFSQTDILALRDAPDSPYGPMGLTKEQQLVQLLSGYWTNDLTPMEAAGMQLAVWEIAVEGVTTGYDLSNGDYIATAPADVVSQGQSYLNSFSGYDGPLSQFLALSGHIEGQEGTTDYVIRVPAPAAIGLCGLGTLLLGFLRRRNMG